MKKENEAIMTDEIIEEIIEETIVEESTPVEAQTETANEKVGKKPDKPSTKSKGSTKEKSESSPTPSGGNDITLGYITKQDKLAANGSVYIQAKLTDLSGNSKSFAIFDGFNIYEKLQKIENGSYVELISSGEGLETAFISLKELPAPEIAVTKSQYDSLKDELRDAIKSVKAPELRKLINAVFSRDDVKNSFFKVPASKTAGYSFESGLLHHTVRLIRLSKAVSAVFNGWEHKKKPYSISDDLLITACILHDIGKGRAIKKERNKYVSTFEGELCQESYLTMKIINEEADKLEIPEDKRIMIEHILSTSRGEISYGALAVPRTREAIMFHLIESLDVKMGNFEHLDNVTVNGDFAQLFKTNLFLGGYEF